MAPSTALCAHPVAREGNALGEGPLWVRRSRRLLWTDIMGRCLYELDPDTGSLGRHRFPYYLACLGEAEGGGLVAASAVGWLLLPGDLRDPSVLGPPPFDAAAVRFNDGKVGPDGAFWAGCMDLNARDPVAALYRFAPSAGDAPRDRFEVSLREQALTISNGIGWSPDRKTMYLTDSGPAVIWRYDFHEQTGSIANRRVFVDNAAGSGVPDGLAVDAEGNVWSAQWGAGAVICYDPGGRERARIAVPAPNTSSCCFGGDPLEVLYITSARHGLGSPGELDGALFACQCPAGLRGQEPYLFALDPGHPRGGRR